MKQFLIAGLSIFLLQLTCVAQRINATEKRYLQKKEDSLKTLAITIIQGRTLEERFEADSQFTKILVRALQGKNSFQYPFDSLISISKLVPKDSTFKIFTWHLVIDENNVRQHGAIQMRTNDGSLQLFPLIDRTPVISNIEDTITSNYGWVGAIYYSLIEKMAFGKKYYTLLGYDENNLSSNKKIIEVLTFKEGQPVFGGSYFSFPDNGFTKKSMARYIMEYKKNAGPRLTYDAEMDMILYEHLISETGEPAKKYTYIPDGDYEGLKWKDGKWVHIAKVFNQATPEGQEPVPHPIRDAKGNIDHSKLNQRVPEGFNSNEADSIEVDSGSTQKKIRRVIRKGTNQ